MSFVKVLLMMMFALLLGAAIVGGCAYNGHKRAVTMDEAVNSAWAQVENQLQARFDLVDNLVATVKGVAGHEKEVFLGLAAARKAYFQSSTTAGKATATGTFESALSRLLVFKESYPQLKSNESFLKLQDTLEGTERRLAVERKRYNDAVKGLNTFVRTLTGKIYASWADVEAAEYFKVAEEAKAVPKVSFSDEKKDE